MLAELPKFKNKLQKRLITKCPILYIQSDVLFQVSEWSMWWWTGCENAMNVTR
jgi:hypothetical protein